MVVRRTFLKSKKLLLGGLVLLGLVAASGWTGYQALAEGRTAQNTHGSPMHPVFALLDASGENVLYSGEPVSTLKTCGSCHDTEFIAANSDHAQLGLDELPAPGEGAVEQAASTEMSCFLCHTPRPNNAARLSELKAGNASWANTAVLLGSGIVTGGSGRYAYAKEVFEADGKLAQAHVQIQDPSNENCGQCHGTVHTDPAEPVVKAGYAPAEWRAATTGQVISPQKLSASGMNLANKESLSLSWDVHAERNLSCTDCHFSLNNPVYYQEGRETRPEHLSFDPRRLELGEYLQRPVHQFARGVSGMAATQPELENTMRRCDGCHSVQTTHDWLPYQERHVAALSCEGCHIPQVYAPAFQQVDWTALLPDASPRLVYRGVEGQAGSPGALVTGYQPVLMPRDQAGGKTQVAPYNLVTTWRWVAGEPAQPVSLDDLKAAWLEGGVYPAEVLAAFDAEGDGALGEGELPLNSREKVEIIATRLAAQGLQNPRITGEIQSYSLNHGVATGEWVTRDCQTCHGENSRLAAPLLLADSTPGGVTPVFVADSTAGTNGRVYREADGKLYYQPVTQAGGLYILGHNRVGWIDLAGGLIFLGTLLGVAAHGSLRFFTVLSRPHGTPALRRVYMYGVYERLWHWLQTITILGLLFTGLVIHKPETFGLFSFRGMVLVHNVLAGILLANAALSLFYHLASGEIRQYLPRPAGFFDQAISQSLFYLRGIFKGDPHPFEKTQQQKLNPLQQATYFGLLNVLLPLQVITGALMWGVQRWPELTARLGGLPFLAPFHTLIAWLFASFIVGHVYLTTTAHSPFASIQAMMMGWDEVEALASAEATASAEAVTSGKAVPSFEATASAGAAPVDLNRPAEETVEA